MDLILFLVIAIVVGYRLFSVLGRKDFDPDNVEKLLTEHHRRVLEGEAVEETEGVDKKGKVDAVVYSAAISRGIKSIQKYLPEFSAEEFEEGAKKAFEWILRAYSTGDVETLKRLVSKEELAEFTKAISAKEKKKQKEEIVIVSEPEVTIESIEVERHTARVKTKIISEQIDFVQDKEGEVVEGDASQIDKITDIWVFEKNLKSSDPNWILVETEIAN